jgi:hypothetical protein
MTAKTIPVKLATIGTVVKTAYGAWLVAYSAPWIEEGEDIGYDAASSLAKAKACLRRYAEDGGYSAPFRWEQEGDHLYRLYAKPSPEDDEEADQAD